MKCVNCGGKTKGNLVVCPNCMGVDGRVHVLDSHTCGSFIQMKGEVEGVCQNYYLCAPIKKALQNELLIENNLGHVVCPYPGINLGKIIYSGIPEGSPKTNYKECFE